MMRRHFLKVFLILFIMGMSAIVMGQYEPKGPTTGKLPIEEVIIETAGGKRVTLQLEVAQKPIDLQLGLMYREHLDDNYGMIFLMGREPRVTSFWMKNTLIPLDMMFVAADGRIAHIHRNATPESLSPVSSREEVVGVIEVAGGGADKLGISIGDRVIYSYFEQSLEK